MFEALSKTQPQIASQLSNLVENKAFPSSSLFYGNSYTGRMYAAMDVAKEMEVPQENIVIVSDRSHYSRIMSAIALVKKSRNNAAKAFLKDNVNIMLRQYHGALFGEQSASERKKFSDAAEISELLERLCSVNDNELDALVNSIEKFVNSLVSANRTQAISIGQVRAIRDWCSTSSMDGEKKLVVVEGLENALGAAVNAFLKTLEEPPKDTYFILISSNPGRILATILSRVRKFRFETLSQEAIKYIFNSLFINSNKYETLEQFFLEGIGIDDAKLKQMAKSLVVTHDANVPSIVDELEKNNGWEVFFSHVLDKLYEGQISGTIDSRKAKYLIDGINEMVYKAKVFNQNKRLTLDYVIYRTKEVLG